MLCQDRAHSCEHLSLPILHNVFNFEQSFRLICKRRSTVRLFGGWHIHIERNVSQCYENLRWQFAKENSSFSSQLNPNIAGGLSTSESSFQRNEPLGAPGKKTFISCVLLFSIFYYYYFYYFIYLFFFFFLQGEAVRVARSLSTRMNRNDVSDIISRMKKQIPADTQTCVHGQPFFEKIAKIPKE